MMKSCWSTSLSWLEHILSTRGLMSSRPAFPGRASLTLSSPVRLGCVVGCARCDGAVKCLKLRFVWELILSLKNKWRIAVVKSRSPTNRNGSFEFSHLFGKKKTSSHSLLRPRNPFLVHYLVECTLSSTAGDITSKVSPQQELLFLSFIHLHADMIKRCLQCNLFMMFA